MSELNIPGFIAFLRGEVTIDGHWFGGDGPIRGGIRRNFWWREHLPKLSSHIERQDAEIAQLRADLSESRLLLDEAREPMEAKLARAGVFKGADGLRKLLNARSFWDDQPYGTRLYFGPNADDYLHHSILKTAIELLDASPVPSQPAADVADICNAYESGVGHAGRPTAKVNPYREGSPEHEAYAIGASGTKHNGQPAAPVAQVPEGFVMVPAKPTSDQLIAGAKTMFRSHGTQKGVVGEMYAAMLATAPSAKGGA